MTAGKNLLCTYVVLWALAVGNTVDALGVASEEERVESVTAPTSEETPSENETPSGEPITEGVTEGERRVLQLYDVAEPSVSSMLIWYLKPEGSGCTKRRLAVSIVGEQSQNTPVALILEKLHSVFEVRIKYGPQWLLFLSKISSWRYLESSSLLRHLYPKGLSPISPATLVKDLGTKDLFVGRLDGKKTCETLSLDDAPLAALPVATEGALPAVTMEAQAHMEKKPASASYPSFSLTNTFSIEKLLQRMLPTTDHLSDVKKDGSDAEGSEHPDSGRQSSEEEKPKKLDPTAVYLHTQPQLDLLFPAKTYFPIRVLDPLTGEITADVQAVHAYPASGSSYVCCSTRYLRVSETSWNLVRSPDTWGPRRGLFGSTPNLLARLLVARPGSVSEQQPQVVLLKLYKNPENGREFWEETLLSWELSAVPAATEESRPTQTFRQMLAANSRFVSSVTRLIAQSSLTRLLVNQMVKLYNINKEEMLSMWDKDPQHSAVKTTTAQGVFTRPINTPILRPIDPRDVLVAPADSVIQRMYQLEPDDERDIQNIIIPQIKGTAFNLMAFIWGGDETGGMRLKATENRLNVLIHYLSPQDYHRVHSPADWTIEKKIYIPGCTPSVNRKNLSQTSILHEIERTSLVGTWDPTGTGNQLFFSLTLVAATFVGGISLAWEENPAKPHNTLQECSKISEVFREDINVPMCVGQELGSFRLGSTVVLIFESPPDFDLSSVGSCGAVRVGQTEGKLASGIRRPPGRCSAYYSAYGSPIEYLSWLRENGETAGKELVKNKQLPESWRSCPSAAVNETIRSLERGLLNVNALGQQIFHHFVEDRTTWEKVIIGQPVELVKSGGADATRSRLSATCFPSANKKQIRVKLQGQNSTLVLFFKTTGEEGLLFKHPHFGCDGDVHLGSTAAGLGAAWQVDDRGDLNVQLTVTCGMGGEDGCAMTDGAALLRGVIHLQARCGIDWGALLPGSAVSECTVRNLASTIRSATNFDVTTKEFIC